MVCEAGSTSVAVPFAEAESNRNQETSIGDGQRLRSSTYCESDEPEPDHMTSLMTIDADILAYVTTDCELFSASLTLPGTALTEVVP